MVPLSGVRTRGTSLQGQMELDHALRLLVEVQPVGGDVRLFGGLVEVALDHHEEIGLDSAVVDLGFLG